MPLCVFCVVCCAFVRCALCVLLVCHADHPSSSPTHTHTSRVYVQNAPRRVAHSKRPPCVPAPRPKCSQVLPHAGVVPVHTGTFGMYTRGFQRATPHHTHRPRPQRHTHTTQQRQPQQHTETGTDRDRERQSETEKEDRERKTEKVERQDKTRQDKTRREKREERI